MIDPGEGVRRVHFALPSGRWIALYLEGGRIVHADAPELRRFVGRNMRDLLDDKPILSEDLGERPVPGLAFSREL